MKIDNYQRTNTPSAVFRRGTASASRWLGGVMAALAGNPPVKSPHSAISGLGAVVVPEASARWIGPRASQMTPERIGWLLESALLSSSPAEEHELYDLMLETWPELQKCTSEVKNAVLSQPCTVAAGDSTDERMVQLLRRAMNGMRGDAITDAQGWRGTLEELLDGWTRGIAVSEIIWQARGGTQEDLAVLPWQTRAIPARAFGWTDAPGGWLGRLVLYPDGNTAKPVEIPAHKFLIAVGKARKGHPSRGALLRPLAWWWCSANFSREWLLNYAQLFGQPFRWAEYDPANPNARAALEQMMMQMGAAAWGVGPAGTKVNFVEAKGNAGTNPQSQIMEMADKCCQILLLGQTLTSTEGSSGSLALGQVHSAVRGDIIETAAKWLANVLNEQLVPAIAALNGGAVGDDAALPYYVIGSDQPVDGKARAETAKIWAEMGLPVPKEYLYDYLDIPMPAAGEDVFPTAAPLPPDIRAKLARMPVETRLYVGSRLGVDL